MKLELINQFMKDVSDCGLYFNNARRVYHECLELLYKNGYDVRVTPKGEPLMSFNQDKKILMLIDEAHEAAFTYIRSRPDTKRRMVEEFERLEQDRKAAEKYYQKYGTKGEF